MSNYKKNISILIIKPSSLGDIVQMLQVVEGACRSAINNGFLIKIDWIVRDCFMDLLNLSPYVSRIFLFNRSGGLSGFIKLMTEIRKNEYDFVIDAQGLFRSGLMTFFSKGKTKIGRKDSREFSWLFYEKTYWPNLKNNSKIHAIDILAVLFNPLGIKFKPQVPITLKNDKASIALIENGIFLFPRSRGREKEWPMFDELTKKLLNETDFRCIWLDQNKIDVNIKHGRFVNLTGKTCLKDLIFLIKNAKCVIANDSGALHIGAALNVPIVGLYGPTSSVKHGPWPIGKRCALQAKNCDLRNLSVDLVFKSVIEQVKIAESINKNP